MRVLAIVHEPDAGPGVFGEAVRAHGDELDEWLLPEGGPPPADPAGYEAVMTFGGSMHADQESQHPWLAGEKALLRELIEARVPLLGICLGSQLVAEAAGAPVEAAPEPEIGWFQVELTPEGVADPLLAPLAPRFTAFQWHSYRSPLPPAPSRSRGARPRCRRSAPASAPGASSSTPRSRSARDRLDRALRGGREGGRDRPRPRRDGRLDPRADRDVERDRPRALRKVSRSG